MSKPVFTESQRFNQLWIWILLGLSILLSLGVLIAVYLQAHSPEKEQEVMMAFAIDVCVMGLVVALLAGIRLETRIDPIGIHYKFRPFVWRWQLIPVSEIRSAEVIKYNPLDYGGWGYRLGWLGRGRAMNIRGNRGIIIEKTNGKKLLIGTQQPEEAARALVHMTEKEL